MEENNKAKSFFSKLSAAGKTVKETYDQTKKAAEEAGITGDSIIEAAKKTKDVLFKAGSEAAVIGKKAADTAQETYNKSKEIMIQKMDQNGDGQVDVVDIIIMSLKIPGIHVNRSQFLQKELFKNHPQEVIDIAIAETPAKAGIPREEIDKIADEVINFERNCVSGISAALGMPGGVVMAATIPVDIAQYYGYTLRAAQKLMYLYGFPEIDSFENDLNLDTETINTLTLCLGVMYGAAGANKAIQGMAKALAIGVEKQLLRSALTKGAIYPFVKSVAKWFGVKMTKEIFAGFFKKTIPVVGGVIGGGITFATFKPCCNRLKTVLKDTMLSNPDHVSSAEEDAIVDSIVTCKIPEADFYPVDESDFDQNSN
ncbi:MAG: hypothetical protein II969_11230 [Anaerolineaceae bacterium]|nr:hypothetical protein [Anaerolineaceae bacterium]